MFGMGTQVRPFGEIFNPDYEGANQFHRFVEYYGYRKLVKEFGSERALDEFFKGLSSDRTARHFDLMFNQIDMTCLAWSGFAERFIFGYLKARRAVVLSLSRSPTDIYQSNLRLLAGSEPHYYGNGTNVPASANIDINETDLATLTEYLIKLRNEIDRSFALYPHYVKLSYDEIAATGRIPDAAIKTIVSASFEHGIVMDADMIQVGQSPMVPTPKT